MSETQRLAELRAHPELYDLDRQILEKNLYGVDLNKEAVEICRLSLWIRTAERGKTLTNLDANIRMGNSVEPPPPPPQVCHRLDRLAKKRNFCLAGRSILCSS